MNESGWHAYAEAINPTLLLLLGAFIGFSLTGLQSYLNRKRRRVSLASALLIELRTLEHPISLRYEDTKAGEGRGVLLTPVFDDFSGDLLLLRHDHTYPVIHFYGFIADVNKHLETARARLAKDESA